jgi:hypothetical protein
VGQERKSRTAVRRQLEQGKEKKKETTKLEATGEEMLVLVEAGGG